MFIKPGSLSKQVTEIEIERRQTIQENREKMKALGIQPMANSLLPSNQNAKGKRTKDGKNKVGHGADPEYVPPEGEKSSSCSDDDESSRPPVKKDEIVKMIAEQSQPDVINPLSEEQVSVEVLGKRSGYLKGYGIHRSRYGTQSQGLPNSEVVALKQQVVDQGKIMADQGKVIADYGKKFEKMMLMLASGVDPATIPGLIQGSESGDDASGGEQAFY